jgi:hypothetical protein
MSHGEPNGTWRLVIGGTLVALWWPQLVKFGHLDDAIVLVVAVIAVESARRERSTAAGSLAGFAVAVKPTGLFLLALALPRSGWRSFKPWLPAAIGLAIAVLPWLPFVIVVPETIDASRSVAAVNPDAAVSLFVAVGTQPSGGYRALQLLLMLGASGLAMLRVGPSAVLATGVAMRMLLDPATLPYYTPALVIGTLVWDLCETRRRIPWMTIAVAMLLPTRAVLENTEIRLWLRLVAVVGVTAAIFLAPRSRRQRSRSELGGEVLAERASNALRVSDA